MSLCPITTVTYQEPTAGPKTREHAKHPGDG